MKNFSPINEKYKVARILMAIITMVSTVGFSPISVLATEPIVPTNNNCYEIDFINKVYNGDGTSTWNYVISKKDGCEGVDISHWIWSPCFAESNLSEKVISSYPEGAEIGLDGSTGYYGVKWEANGFNWDTNITFGITINGQPALSESGTLGIIKAGDNHFDLTIPGPSCEPVIIPVCGDGIINQDTEQCDDGNTVDGDGCDSQCQIEQIQEGCAPGETQIDFEYLSKPQITTIDSDTTDYAYKLCSDIYNGVSVDTSNGQPHYIYLTWDNFNPSEYDGFLNFDLKLYHMENQSTLKVELKNQFGIWVEVCDPAERTSYTWDDCDLAPFEHILKEVSKVELRIVGLRDGACRQYLKCAKLDLEVYKCESPEPYCGDGKIDIGEDCDYGNQNGVVCEAAYGETCEYCSETCEIVEVEGPYCGDGNLDEGEECEIGHECECGEGYFCDVEKCVCEQKPEEPLGSITVCKIIADSEGNIIDGFEFSGTNFSISGFTPEPLPSTGAPIGELPNSIFIAPLSLSDDIIGNDGINDADCIIYTDLEFGSYYYEQELLFADGWEKPLYNDQFTVEVDDLSDLYEYDNKLFDGDPSNDGDRNENVDGHIVISKSRPDRTLIVFNQREKIIVEPFCGDGNLDEGEECDDGNNNDGDGCSANCTIELPVCDINIELVENGGFESPLIAGSQSWGIFTDSALGGWHVEWMSLSPSEFGGYSRPTNAYLELQNDLTGWAPQEGSQYAELDSDWDGYGGSLSGEPASVKIYQDIQTIPGETYTVSFWFSPRPNTALENNRLGFNWSGDVVANDIEGAGENTTTWTKHTYEFVATSNSARIQFSDLGAPSDSTGTFIDNVSVRCGTYEPEPYCGDGNIDDGEECDGDVGVPENYICTPQCTLEYVPYCGDGIINQTSEECDGEDGVGENQACTSQCILIDIPWCGDGVKNGEEECDGTDGVGTNQSCSGTCTLINLPYCGDGNIDSGEQCDNGAQNGQICTPGCGSTCSYCSAVCTIITLTGGTCGGGGGGGGGSSYPALAITKFVIEDVANPGQTLHYTIKLKNNGNAPATSVKLTDTLPNGFTFSDTGLAYKEWDLGDITMGVEKITSYEVIVGANVLAGEYKNVASAKATNQGVIYANAMIVILGEVLGERIELPNTGIDSFWLIFAGLSLIWLSLIGTYLILFSSRCKIQNEVIN